MSLFCKTKFNENPKQTAHYESNDFFASILFVDVSGNV